MKGKIEWPDMNMYQKSTIAIHIEFIQVLMNKWGGKMLVLFSSINVKDPYNFEVVYCSIIT